MYSHLYTLHCLALIQDVDSLYMHVLILCETKVYTL